MAYLYAQLSNGDYVQVDVNDIKPVAAADAKAQLAKTLSSGVASKGTFVATGAVAVSVADTAMKITSIVLFSLNTVGGTVGAIPRVVTITAGTGFNANCTASDTSTYNYWIINP